MLKVTMRQADGEPVVFLGLTDKDLLQLRNNQTLALSAPELGLPHGKAFLLYRGSVEELHTAMKDAGLPVPDLPAAR